MPELYVDTRKVGGAFSVDECARRLVHYRFAENVCMTSAAGWASSTPSIKLKFALGEHCYQDSIHSYWLGQRLPELRVTDRIDIATPPTFRTSNVAEPPNEAFLKFCETMQLQTDQLLRLTGLYRVLKNHLLVYYRHHLAVTDPVCDAPTVRILRHILLEEEEHLAFGMAMFEELADTPEKRRAAMEWQTELEVLLMTSGGVTGGK
jgi:hypothetical protein